ncbi:hypothetical protein MRY87_12470 [bacterium]|nr:hypothetical protein [bacterium]
MKGVQQEQQRQLGFGGKGVRHEVFQGFEDARTPLERRPLRRYSTLSHRALLISSLAISLSGCGLLSMGVPSENAEPKSYAAHGDEENYPKLNGSLVIAKRLPQVTEIAQLPLYGFLPLRSVTPQSHSVLQPSEPEKSFPTVFENPRWIEISVTANVLALHGERASSFSTEITPDSSFLHSKSPSSKGLGFSTELGATRTSVLAIEHSPVWMAPDSYFEDRGLPVPPEGDASRFLKFALGDVALFLENGLVIHSGKENGHLGANLLRVEAASLNRLANRVQSGDKVVIRR